MGVDEPLVFEKIEQIGCRLIFSDITGWAIVGQSFKDTLFNKKMIKLTIKTIENIENGIPSSLLKLEEGMIINIDCYSLLVARIF